MNYVGCIECKKKDFVLIANKVAEDDDGEEIITYDRKEAELLPTVQTCSGLKRLIPRSLCVES